MRDDVVQVFSELDIPSTWEAIPHYFLFWPEERDEAVHSFGVAGCGDIESVALCCPATLDFWEKLNPFFILEGYGNALFLRAPATRLYCRISARLW